MVFIHQCTVEVSLQCSVRKADKASVMGEVYVTNQKRKEILSIERRGRCADNSRCILD